jgi:hypothetical protein
MGYQTKGGRWAATHAFTLAASAVRTANGAGSAVEAADKGVARLLLDVTARSGTTPTLDVVIQTSHDGTTWRTAHTFTQATATGQQRAAFAIDRFVRASWTVGGTTPSFTFSIKGEGA